MSVLTCHMYMHVHNYIILDPCMLHKDDRIRVIEVDKSDRTKMKQYGELKSPSREVIYTITFLNFDKKEKDLPVFKVPAVCF